MTRFLRRSAWIAFACLTAGCTALASTLTLRLDRSQLQQAVEAKFPVSREALLTTVTLRDPQIILRDDDHRIGIDLEAEVRAPIGRPYRGRLAAVGEVIYDPPTHSFFFRSPEIQRLNFPGLPRKARPLVASAIEAAAGPLIESTPLHHLPESDPGERATRYFLQEVTVRDGAVHLTLGLPQRDLAALRRNEWIAWAVAAALAVGFVALLRRRRSP